MAELADALDSGSSGHCARAGSSPVIRSNCGKDHCEAQWSFLFSKKEVAFPEIKERFEKKKKFYRKMLDIFLLMQYYSQAH